MLKVISLHVRTNWSGFSHVTSSLTATEKSKMDRFVTSPYLCCRDSEECFCLPSIATIEEIVTSCESWLWLTDRFAVAIDIHSVDNNNANFGHLTREYSCLLNHFLTHRAEIECGVTGRRRYSPLLSIHR